MHVSKWVGKKIKTYKSNIKSIKKKLNVDVKYCGSFKSFDFIYILVANPHVVRNNFLDKILF